MISLPPRVVIYGTGRFGCLLAKALLEKDWLIVAAFDLASDKVGQDLGRLCGLERDIGVVVQHGGTADFSAIKADIALVAARDAPKDNMAAYTGLMSAGINVLCQGGGSSYVWDYDPETALQIDTLAKANNVTWTGGGAWDLCRIWPGILIAGACTRIKSLHHQALTSLTRAPAAMRHLVEAYGVGLTEDQFRASMIDFQGRYGGVYRSVIPQVLGALGFETTDVTERIEGIFRSEPVYCKAFEREIPVGECSGMKVTITADTRQGVTCTGESIFELAGDVNDRFTWKVDGDAPNCITVERFNAPATTVGLMINRILDVIAAAPGLQDVSRLGPPKTSASF